AGPLLMGGGAGNREDGVEVAPERLRFQFRDEGHGERIYRLDLTPTPLLKERGLKILALAVLPSPSGEGPGVRSSYVGAPIYWSPLPRRKRHAASLPEP